MYSHFKDEVSKYNNFNFLDLNINFEKHYEKNKRKFNFEYDWHWNKLGHKLAAKGVIEKIILK